MAHPRGKPSAALYRSEQDEMKHGEEHGKIALGGNPVLDIAHALEGALYLGYTGHETDDEEEGHRMAVHGDDIAQPDDDGRGAKELLIGEAELHPEQHGKPNRHASKGGIEQHHHILNLKLGGATDLIKSTEIQTARKLEAKGRNDIDPGLQRARHPPLHHGHAETHLRWWRGRLHQIFGQFSHHSSTLQTTLYPPCNFDRSSEASIRMRTVTRCSTFTKLPVALSTGISENALPVASEMRSTTPV